MDFRRNVIEQYSYKRREHVQDIFYEKTEVFNVYTNNEMNFVETNRELKEIYKRFWSSLHTERLTNL